MSTLDWKRKLAAYLHDPPSKCLDIRTHGERSDAAFRQAGFTDETEIGEYFAHADHTSAAADRLPFPWWQSSRLSCAFDGIRNASLHPLGGPEGQSLKLPFHAEFKSVAQGIEGEGDVQPALTLESLANLRDEDERWRARFFAHWRLWAKHAMEKDYRLALLPADTRIPDHSIWTHMQVTSALAGCEEGEADEARLKPAFLRFQIGPVQDFIAAARSIRDLWSGSYLLSWLMAAGLKALTAKAGPDAVIFPNLLGQPLFDLHWREELWDRVNIGSKSVWDSLAHDGQTLLTPNLPNIFLAVVPASRAAELGKLVEDALRKEWKSIAAKVWQFCDEKVLPGPERTNLTADEGALTRQLRQQRFDAQVNRFLSISWQATPWPDTLEAALKLADGFDQEMPIEKACDRVRAAVDMAERQMPKTHRDVRYFECERFPKGHPQAGWKDPSKLKDDAKLDNIGLGWSVILAFNGWQLDAVRQTRNFDAWAAGGWGIGAANNKDGLNGRDEAVAGGDKWFESCRRLGKPWPWRFKKADWVGAVTLVKRLWDIAYLKPGWNLAVPKMPNTRGIAAHDPFAKDDKFNDDAQSEDVENLPPSEKYFAILALDGDAIGKWVSGEKTPLFASQLADYPDGSNAQRFGSKPYFEKPEFKDFLKAQRPLSPSYHLQFSEALGNFALLCARPIVEAFDGRLIYAGGDDVVALLPADIALACAQALRMAFTGSEELGGFLVEQAARLQAQNEKAEQDVPWAQAMAAQGRLLAVATTTRGGSAVSHPGFLIRLDDAQKPADQRHFADGEGRPIPFLVPGPAADCSVGLAIAHFKSPLQDVVRAAQDAEKRAKKQLGRSAVAVTLFKRSGETIEWGCQWDSCGLDVYDAVMKAMAAGAVSSKFPHRVVELLDGYLTESSPLAAKSLEPLQDFPVVDVALREFRHALDRQGQDKKSGEYARLAEFAREEPQEKALLKNYLGRVKQEAEAKLKKAREDSSKWSSLAPEEKRRLEIGPVEAPVQALIGLCQTAAFIDRNRDKSDNSPSVSSASSAPSKVATPHSVLRTPQSV